MAPDPTPGLFHLPLNLEGNTPSYAIHARIDSISSVLKEDYGALHLAANNLLGLLHFHVKERKDAQNCFVKVLEKDPNNLNALANLRHVYTVRKIEKEKEKYSQMLATAMDCSDKERVLRFARCRAEQAYCSGFECLKNPEMDIKRYKMSTAEFNQAISDVTEAGLSREPWDNEEWTVSDEVTEWKLCKVWNWKRIYNHTYKERQEQRPHVFHQVLKLLCELLKDVRGKGGLVEAQVFTYIAYFFWKQPQDMLPETKKLIAEKGLKNYLADPETCFKEAMDVFSQSTDVTNQYACYIMYRQERRNRYEQIIQDLSVIVDKYKNWFARSKRGETYKMWYLHQCRDEAIPDPDKELLENAKEDFEEVKKRNPSSFVMGHLGETCILLGTDRSRESVESEGEIHEAVDFLQDAEAYGDADHGERNGLLARCHRLLGSEDREVQFLKRSVETTQAGNRNLDNAKRLLHLLLQRYKGERGKIPPEANIEKNSRAKSAFVDVFYWTVTFCFKHFRASDVIDKHLQKLVHGNEEIFADIRAALTSLPLESERLQRLQRLDDVMSKAGMDVEQQQAKAWDVRGLGLCPLPPPDHPKCTDFEYDFFVLYALDGDDERWVLCRLFPALEDIHSKGRLKGFRLERDSELGKTKIKNLDSAVKKSRKIIMVLSPAFFESPFLEHGKDTSLYHVLEKRGQGLDKVIIPVIFENCEVPDSLAYLRALDISNAIDDSDLPLIRKAVES